mmetsp:Transcript_20904/g.43620  ORF Transcript_20904/g.43620 Transcript_20904/m.43620 type:complete len:99 (-) Transcript_20904:91-387(-)
MIRALLKASEVFNSWLEGPYSTWVKVIYISFFFGAGVLGLWGLAKNLETLRDEHEAKVQEVLAEKMATSGQAKEDKAAAASCKRRTGKEGQSSENSDG